MTCLLCSGAVDDSITFKDLFCLRKTSSTCCSNCIQAFEKIAGQHCPFCYRSGQSTICNDCLRWQQKNQEVQHVALYGYNDAMKSYFSRYKFQGDYLLRELFGKEIQKELLNYKGYTVVPIPSSPLLEKTRGFNPVEGLLEAAGIAYQNLLTKTEDYKQSEKNREERLKTKNSFQLKEGNSLPEKLLIVDDIYTTGVTIQLAKQCFLEKGVKEVRTFSLAR